MTSSELPGCNVDRVGQADAIRCADTSRDAGDLFLDRDDRTDRGRTYELPVQSLQLCVATSQRLDQDFT